jgi:hypothetical protein
VVESVSQHPRLCARIPTLADTAATTTALLAFFLEGLVATALPTDPGCLLGVALSRGVRGPGLQRQGFRRHRRRPDRLRRAARLDHAVHPRDGLVHAIDEVHAIGRSDG